MKAKLLISKIGLILLCMFAFSLTGCKRELAIEQPESFGPAPTEEPAFGVVKMGGEDGVKTPTK